MADLGQYTVFEILLFLPLSPSPPLGVSLGYGFVNYGTAEEAECAIQKMNGTSLDNKTLKVSYARPSSVAIKNANVYVANLPSQLSQPELEALFQPYGTIITSKILTDQDTGLGRGCGFVRFDKYAQAEVAISALNGKQLVGGKQPLLVKFANPPKATAPETGTVPGGLAAINQIPQAQKRVTNNTTGTSTASSMMYSSSTNGGSVGPMRHIPTVSNMRYNPVSTLATPGMVANPAAAGMVTPAAMAALTGITTGVANLANLTPVAGGNGAAMATASDTNYCIFVYNLPETCQDFLLYQLFSPFGAITSVNVIRDLKSGLCKRYGFVNMKNYEDACSAIMTLNGYVHDGKTLQVSFKNQKT